MPFAPALRTQSGVAFSVWLQQMMRKAICLPSRIQFCATESKMSQRYAPSCGSTSFHSTRRYTTDVPGNGSVSPGFEYIPYAHSLLE